MKRALLAFLFGTASVLSACETPAPVTAVRIPKMVFPDASQTAYVWSSAEGPRNDLFELQDYATITRIGDVGVPDYVLPWAGGSPVYAWLLEIPIGHHEIEIIYKEDIFCAFLGCTTLEQDRQSLALLALPNRVYVPFVADACSRDWFWIEDWGPFVKETETRRFITKMRSNFSNQVVAGERPPKDSCDQIE